MLLADTLASPTGHMRAYLEARGWALPADTHTIPNVMPTFEPHQAPAGEGTPPDMGSNKRVQHTVTPFHTCFSCGHLEHQG
jgi:hypothetical protein